MNDNNIVDINSHPSDYDNKDQTKNVQDTIMEKEEIGIFESTIANILNDLKHPEDLKQSFSILEDDYLEAKNIIPISKGEFDAIQKQFPNESFLKIKKKIDNLPSLGPSIDKLLSIVDLINNICRDSIKRQPYLNKVQYYEKIIIKWRRVKGDGNCFFRSVIYQYLEYIILNKNDQMLKNVIFDLFKNYSEQSFKTRLMKYQINIERVVLILLLINFALSLKDINEAITKAMSILIKAFNNYKDFDYCMIMHLRYEIYKYLKDNEGKLYSKTFSVNIGNLLQSVYENGHGEFFYQKFYETNLLEMGKEAEKIIIYITPFVLQMNMKIFSYDFGKIENELNEFDFECPDLRKNKNKSKKEIITLMYLGNHFDVTYETEYYNKFASYLREEKTPVKHPVLSVKIDNMPITTAGNANLNIKVNLNSNINMNNKAISQVQFNHCKTDQIQGSLNQNLYQKQTSNTEPPASSTSLQQTLKLQPTLIAQCLKPNECAVCHTKVNRNFVCDQCHSNQLKAWFKKKYVCFINFNQNNLLNQKATYPLKQYFNELTINYDNEEKVTFEKAFGSLNPSTQFNIQNTIADIKSSLCLCCHQLIKESDDSIVFEMPCGCSLCKTDCLRNFFKLIPFENRINYSCICGTEYDITQLKYLVNFFKSHGLKKYKNNVIRFVYAKMKNKCANCKKDFNLQQSNCVNVLEVKDEEIEKIFNISRFHHLICDHCLLVLTETYNKSKENVFKCCLCNSNHYILKRFSTKAEIINEASCTIF